MRYGDGGRALQLTSDHHPPFVVALAVIEIFRLLYGITFTSLFATYQLNTAERDRDGEQISLELHSPWPFKGYSDITLEEFNLSKKHVPAV